MESPIATARQKEGCLPCSTCQCLSPATTTITTHCPGESLSLSLGRHPPGDCQVTVASEPRPPLSFSDCVKGCPCVYEWPRVSVWVYVYLSMLAFACVYTFISMCACLSLRVCEYACLCCLFLVYISVCTCECVQVEVYVFAFICMDV